MLQGCRHLLSRIFSSSRKWLSRRVDWIVSDDFMKSSFCHSCVPWNIWQPNPALKRLTILFLALEGKGLLVPCIRRQRFTRTVKASKRISCHLELGNLNLCSDHVQTSVHRSENRYFTCIKLWRLLFIFSAGFWLSHKTSSHRISCLVEISDSFGFSF